MLQSVINLSALPAPAVITQLSFEEIFADMLADFQTRFPTFTALVESDPAYMIMQACAYREMLLRQQAQEFAVGNMLAYATGSSLDNLAANLNVLREGTPASLTIGSGNAGILFTAVAGGAAGNSIAVAFLAPASPLGILSVATTGTTIAVTLATDVNGNILSTAAQIATLVNQDPTASTLVEATLTGTGASAVAVAASALLTGGVDETDDSLRARAQLAFEGFSCAGPKGAYRYFALTVAGVADVSVQGTNDDDTIAVGTVVVCLLGTNGALADPNPATAGESGEDPILGNVRTVLNTDDVRPLNDTVIVRAATAVTFAITAAITTYPGPDPTTVITAAQTAAAAYVAAQQRIGATVTVAGIIAALYQSGVYNISLSAPASDVTTTEYQFPSCTGITLTNAGVGS